MRHVTEAESINVLHDNKTLSLSFRGLHHYHSFMEIEVSEYVDGIHYYYYLAYLSNSSKALKVPPASQFYNN